jgi:ferredoxin
MPWVNNDECIGCGICVEECPVGTISMNGDKAEIDMDNCIRCGVCHKVCPQGAVEHDSEKIPEEVEANVARTKEFMDACVERLGSEKERQKCLNRMIKHFNKERTVAEKTLERLQTLMDS